MSEATIFPSVQSEPYPPSRPLCNLVAGMRHLSHPAFGILIIGLFIVPMTLTFVALQHQKNSVRKEVREMLAKKVQEDQLIVLSFSRQEAEEELEWEHEHEFRYKGMMYDVVSAEMTTDSVSYVCWEDEKETGIDRRIDELVTQWISSNPDTKENQQRLLTFYFQIYDLPYTMHTPFLAENELAYKLHVNYYRGECILPPAPPPRRIG